MAGPLMSTSQFPHSLLWVATDITIGWIQMGDESKGKKTPE